MDRCRPQADLAAAQHAGEPRDGRLALVGRERPQALREQARLSRCGCASPRAPPTRPRARAASWRRSCAHAVMFRHRRRVAASTAIGSVANSSSGSSAAPCTLRRVKTSTAPAASRGNTDPRAAASRGSAPHARESAARPSARSAARAGARTPRSRRRAGPSPRTRRSRPPRTAPARARAAQQRARRRQLDAAVVPLPQPLRERARAVAARAPPRRPRATRAVREIDAPAIVGIDEAEVPELAALVDVGHAGRRELQRQLHEAVVHAEPRDAARERHEPREELVPAAARAPRRRAPSNAAS